MSKAPSVTPDDPPVSIVHLWSVLAALVSRKPVPNDTPLETPGATTAQMIRRDSVLDREAPISFFKSVQPRVALDALLNLATALTREGLATRLSSLPDMDKGGRPLAIALLLRAVDVANRPGEFFVDEQLRNLLDSMLSNPAAQRSLGNLRDEVLRETPAQPARSERDWTVGDVRDLLRYKSRLTKWCEVRRKNLYVDLLKIVAPNAVPLEAWNDFPKSPALTESIAETLPVYMMLPSAIPGGGELTEGTLTELVGAVAFRTGLSVPTLWQMPLDEFGRLVWPPSAPEPGKLQAGAEKSGSRTGPRRKGSKRKPLTPAEERAIELWDRDRAEIRDYATLSEELEKEGHRISVGDIGALMDRVRHRNARAKK